MKMSALAIKNNYFAYLDKMLKKYKPADPVELEEQELTETSVQAEKVNGNEQLSLENAENN